MFIPTITPTKIIDDKESMCIKQMLRNQYVFPSDHRVAGLQGKMICSDSSSQTSLPPETPKTTPPVQVGMLRS